MFKSVLLPKMLELVEKSTILRDGVGITWRDFGWLRSDVLEGLLWVREDCWYTFF